MAAIAANPRTTLFRTDVRSAIQFSRDLSRDEKDAFLRHVQYLTPQEAEELRDILSI